MAVKRWVQTNRSQARIVNTSYYRSSNADTYYSQNSNLSSIEIVWTSRDNFGDLFISIILAFGGWFTVYFVIYLLSIFQTIPAFITVLAPSVTAIIVFTAIFLFLCLITTTGKEFVLDLNSGTISEFHYQLKDRYTKKTIPIRVAYLSKFSRIAVLKKLDSHEHWCYSLEMISDHSDNLQIDHSTSFSSLEELLASTDEELIELQNLGREMADFLQIPMVSEIESDEEIKTQTASPDLLKSIETAVEEIYNLLKSSFGQIHEYRTVNSEDFRGYVDLAYYHRLQSALVEQGYTWAGDVEDMTCAEQLRESNIRTFIRVMNNPTHNTNISFYHINPKVVFGFLSQMKVFDCETEFSPEKYLITTNAKKTQLDYPPGFDAVHLPANAPHKTILKTHYQRLQRAIDTWNLSPTPLHCLDDILAMQKRMAQAKNNYRQRIGYITQQELNRFLNRFDVEPQIARELGRRLRERFTRDTQ